MRWLVACCLLGAIAWSQTSSAKTPTAAEQARALYAKGSMEYNLGHYQAALDAFEAGYRLKPDPAFLFNLAQSYRQLGRSDEAIRSYKAFLRESPDAPNRDEVQKKIEDLEKDRVKESESPAPTPPAQESPREIVQAAPPIQKPKSRRWVWGVVGGVSVVVVGLAVGLGVGLTRGDGYPKANEGAIDGN